MKNSNQCPKCDSREVVKIPSVVGPDANLIRVGYWSLAGIYVTRFACCTCGFTEEWIESSEDLQKLKKKFGT